MFFIFRRNGYRELGEEIDGVSSVFSVEEVGER